MQKKSLSLVILAAGFGKRLGHPDGKLLAPLLGRRLIDFTLDSVFKFMDEQKNIQCSLHLVVGHQGEKLQSYLEEKYKDKEDLFHFIWQHEPRGTGDAVKEYFKQAKEENLNSDYTLVMCGDTPLLPVQILNQLYEQMTCNYQELSGLVCSFLASNPHGLGRIIQAKDSSLPGLHIVEEKETSESEKKICEVNSGLYLLKTSFLKDHLSELKVHGKVQEFYLTDLFQDEYEVQTLHFQNETPFLGVNNQVDLERVTEELRRRKNQKLQEEGVRLLDKKSCYIDWDVDIASQTTIYPHVCIEGETTIGKNVVVEMGTVIKDSTIEDGVMIKASSYIEKTLVQKRAQIGPFAHLRPKTHIGSEVKIGNFVEVKKSHIRKNAKVSHLSYVGDADVGEESNIGCGFITCNYDGKDKHKTEIGQRTFIGSDSQVVAPIKIGDDVFVACGSTITKDIPSKAFALARAKQINKENQSHRFLKKKDKKKT